MWSYKRYHVEKDRCQRTERMGNIENLPGHHFSNRGGVLIQKEYIGFEKYHQNAGSMMRWYQMAYPEKFADKSPPPKTGH